MHHVVKLRSHSGIRLRSFFLENISRPSEPKPLQTEHEGSVGPVFNSSTYYHAAAAVMRTVGTDQTTHTNTASDSLAEIPQ